MTLPALILVPALAALGAWAHRTPAFRTVWLVVAAMVHLALVGLTWIAPPPPAFGGWVAVDDLGLLVLTLVSVLFAAVATYAVGYLRRESPRGGAAFVSCLLAFLAAASLVAVSQHLVLLWVGLESTTLAVAPLIFHRHDRRSLEAVWKYLVTSSVAIAFALLGLFFLATAQGASGRTLVLGDLVAGAPALHGAWLKGAFVLLLTGFGTKMGLAPLHTWKPDTYAEAPSLVSALMAGALTSCAFLGLARITEVAMAARLEAFVRPLLLTFGIVSLAVTALFILAQRDLKRVLAYTSVEHMGLLVLGLGLGTLGAYGSALHVLNNGLGKTLMFLCVGNLVLATGSAEYAANRGALRWLPMSGTLLLLGLFAVTGLPPFGLFISEFTILRAAVAAGHPWLAGGVAALLAVIFVGIARPFLGMLHGAPVGGREPAPEALWLVAGPVALLAAVLVLGLYIPAPLGEVLGRAAAALGGHTP